ncbi:hypothetical protein RP20_CCG011111 [Aedes albopictus]|nr:hypothetical protein RP20_CCG011111 [Aedes albopictus]
MGKACGYGHRLGRRSGLTGTTYNLSSHSEQDRDEWMTVMQKRYLSPQHSSRVPQKVFHQFQVAPSVPQY